MSPMRSFETSISKALLGGALSLASLALVLGAKTASANGRFPFASQLVVDPGDPKHLALRTTYGLLQSMDGGAKWVWVCEKSVGYGGIVDPALAITKDGTVLAGLPDGLAVTHDRGCDFAFAEGDLKGQLVVDVSAEKGDPSHAVALGSTIVGSDVHVVLGASSDDGKTWTTLGTPIPDVFIAQTLDVAPSDANRVYVSGTMSGPKLADGGVGPQVALLERSDDRGKTWQRMTIGEANGDVPYIGAIDPKNPDRVYVRIDRDLKDALYYTDDGGTTWKHAFDSAADLLGFALSPDGTQVAVGGTKDGLWLAKTSDMVFAQSGLRTPLLTSCLPSYMVRCLAWANEGLYVCGSEYCDGFTVGLIETPGALAKQLYHLVELEPLSCPASSATGTTCPEFWPGTQDLLGATDAGTTDDASFGDAEPGAPPPSDSKGCGACAFSGDEHDSPALLASFGLAALLFSRRSLRSRRRARRALPR